MVLAKFAVVRTSIFFVAMLACCFTLFWGVATEGPIGILKNNKEIAVYLIFGLIGSAFSLRLSFFVLYQILFKKAVAVWIEDDSVIYMNKAFLKVARKDLRSIDILPARPRSSIKLIYLHLADGSSKKIGTIFLRESREILLPKLEKWSGLAKINPGDTIGN